MKAAPKALYELQIETENRTSEGFGMVEAPSVLGRECLSDDMTPGYGFSSSGKWSPVKLVDKWKPPKVRGNVSLANDFPGLDMVLPVFSRRACDVLREFLDPNGELLPLQSDIGEYYFYNVTTFVDALDAKKSDCQFWCDPPTTAIAIDYFEFHKSKLKRVVDFSNSRRSDYDNRYRFICRTGQ